MKNEYSTTLALLKFQLYLTLIKFGLSLNLCNRWWINIEHRPVDLYNQVHFVSPILPFIIFSSFLLFNHLQTSFVFVFLCLLYLNCTALKFAKKDTKYPTGDTKKPQGDIKYVSLRFLCKCSVHSLYQFASYLKILKRDYT